MKTSRTKERKKEMDPWSSMSEILINPPPFFCVCSKEVKYVTEFMREEEDINNLEQVGRTHSQDARKRGLLPYE